MKKIIGLTVAALLVMAMVGGGTWAYFSDTESSADNSLSAGTLDLKINNGDSPYTILNLTNKAPGDSGSGSTTLKNAGSLTGEMDIATGAVTNTAGAGGTEFEGGSGELGGVAKIAVYIDVDQSGAWSAGDIGLKNDGTTYNNPTALDYQTIDSYASKTWGGTAGVENMLADAQDNFIIAWQIPTSAGNNIQGDSVSIGFTFTLEQTSAD